MRLLYGADRADSGYVEVAGTPARMTSPRHAIDRRIAFSSEDRREEGIVADLTVAENIVLGIQARRAPQDPPGQAGFGSGRVHGSARRDPPIRTWSPATCRGATSRRCSSPAGSPRARAPDPRRADPGHRCRTKADLQKKVAELSEQGLSVIFISSELEEVLRLAQRIVVMRIANPLASSTRRFDLDGLIDFIANESDGSGA